MNGAALLEGAFARAAGQGRAALIPYLVAGDPNLEVTGQALLAMARRGADLLEVGIPHSDPLADGPVIQAASTRALAGGVRVDGIFSLLREVTPHLGVPVVLLVYANTVFQRGVERFIREAAAAGVSGLIVPDLPPEEGEEYTAAARRAGVATVFLVAPTSTQERLRLVARYSEGFLYCVSVTGVTGERREVSPEALELLRRARECARLPLAVGFGLSRPEQVRTVARQADGVIVGSAVVRVLHEATQSGKEGAVEEAVGALIEELRAAAKWAK